MIDIIEELGKKSPRYLVKYRGLIDESAKKGAINYHERTEESYDLGKFFSNFYEFYIYAAMIGVYIDNPVPIQKKEDTKTFSVPMRDWNSNGSSQTVQYLWMICFVKSNIDLNELERIEDKLVEREMRNVKDKIEAFANGGFEYISSKVNTDTAFFEDEDCFIKLLKEVELELV